jgi:DNA mismatch repair protein MSH6
VARIEQTETPDQLSERQKDKVGSQKEKVVRRELCRITTLGTKTYGVLDGTDSRDMDGTTDPNPCYLMALIERVIF